MYLPPEKELGFVMRTEPKKQNKPISSQRPFRNTFREKPTRLFIKKQTLMPGQEIINNSKQFVTGEIEIICTNEPSISELQQENSF